MPGVDTAITTTVVLDAGGLDGLIKALKSKGFRIVGPRISDDAVIYDDIDSTADLPAGWGDEQKGGHYRLKKRADKALFGYTAAAQSWKRFLFPPKQKLFAATRTASGFKIQPPDKDPPPLAILGARACELAAMRIQGRVFGDKDYAEPGYQARMAGAFVIAVECGQAGGTCFCTSMGTGPEITKGYDIKLVELIDKARHVFVAEAGSGLGADFLAGLKAPKAKDTDIAAAQAKVAKAAQSMGRVMETRTAARLKELPEHARWDEVAARCMTCGNCTMVCPTCFCSTVEDVTDLKGDHAERWRKWDSCFSVDFSYIHGGSVRTEARSRYRQWITHKLSTWHDQFGSFGCVGCGRCITWCPVGIDITEEVAAIHKAEVGTGDKPAAKGRK
ncbi:MAG TPA: 4Fe-4S dicluster domain-containing protein [Candidatus Omnitrophota bacterium]|nr:4Fe-4S dicluster domain-containing protein [Candidatus Omnitrophota bacterium]